jgi:hypothetical protein
MACGPFFLATRDTGSLKKNRDFMFTAEVLFIQGCLLGQPVEAKSP